MKREALRLAFLVAVALAMAGCGAASRSGPVRPPPSSMPLLSASAVSGIGYTTTSLSALDLARDASIPGLASRIDRLGYLAGRQRTFQGESRHLTLVISRFLAFRDAAGASGYVGLVHANAAAFFGAGAASRVLIAEGRTGWLFTLAACACHMANPALIGVLNEGRGVIWLEISGPDATPDLLTSLLDPAAASNV